MLSVRKASSADIPAIKAIDHLMPNEPIREKSLHDAVNNHSAYIICSDANILGYGLIHEHFFGYPFIEMLYIAEPYRNKGNGYVLMNNMIEELQSEKIFTSTNLSNNNMRHVLTRDGWIESGRVDNLDEGDPEIIFLKVKTP